MFVKEYIKVFLLRCYDEKDWRGFERVTQKYSELYGKLKIRKI